MLNLVYRISVREEIVIFERMEVIVVEFDGRIFHKNFFIFVKMNGIYSFATYCVAWMLGRRTIKNIRIGPIILNILRIPSFLIQFSKHLSQLLIGRFLIKPQFSYFSHIFNKFHRTSLTQIHQINTLFNLSNFSMFLRFIFSLYIAPR